MRRVRTGSERGATSVEFALVVPLFFVLIGITAYFAWQMFVESQLERAAQRAARYAAIPTVNGAYAYGQCEVLDEVNRRLASDAVDTTDVVVRDQNGTLLQAACPGAPAATRPRGYVRVRVTRELDNPFASLMTTLLRREDPITLSGSGEARVEDPV